MTNIQALREKIAHLATSAKNMLAEKGSQTWTAEEQTTFDGYTNEIERLQAQIKSAEKLRELEADKFFNAAPGGKPDKAEGETIDAMAAVARRLQLIESSGSHLLGLINDLLDISRIEAGQFVMRTEVFELGALVRNLADLYTVRCTDKGLDFTLTQRMDPPCWVSGDPARVRQVLHNLLGNAVKFTQRGSVCLQLSYDSDSARLDAEVQDTGPGISAENQARLFRPFSQIDSTKTRAHDGAGLGLVGVAMQVGVADKGGALGQPVQQRLAGRRLAGPAQPV